MHMAPVLTLRLPSLRQDNFRPTPLHESSPFKSAAAFSSLLDCPREEDLQPQTYIIQSTGSSFIVRKLVT